MNLRWLLTLLALLALAEESFAPTAILTRKGKEIVVKKTSPDELGLAWIEDGPRGLVFIFFDPPPYRVEARFGEDAVAHASLAVVEQPDEGPERIALGAGSARYDAANDRAVYTLEDAPNAVEIEKGRLHARGSRLDYDNDQGLAQLKGPVRFERGGRTPLKGDAGALLYLVDEDRIWLTGGVAFVQGARRVQASQALIDEAKGVAWLIGDPVTSVSKGERVEGKLLGYDLEHGDLWVIKGVKAELSGD